MADRKAFRCSRTGLLYPEDYVEQWGRKYGRGLGREPVSEALVNNYKRKPVRGRSGKLSHPVFNCRAQVDLVTVTEEEWSKKQAILHIDDAGYAIRGEIMRNKGLVKAGSLVSQLAPEDIPAAKAALKVK